MPRRYELAQLAAAVIAGVSAAVVILILYRGVWLLRRADSCYLQNRLSHSRLSLLSVASSGGLFALFAAAQPWCAVSGFTV